MVSNRSSLWFGFFFTAVYVVDLGQMDLSDGGDALTHGPDVLDTRCPSARPDLTLSRPA